MPDPLSQRATERKIYEEVVNLIVDYVSSEFADDQAARLRVYMLIADNFKGMVKSFKPDVRKPLMGIEFGEVHE
jgi:hypothetical protein